MVLSDHAISPWVSAESLSRKLPRCAELFFASGRNRLVGPSHEMAIVVQQSPNMRRELLAWARQLEVFHPCLITNLPAREAKYLLKRFTLGLAALARACDGRKGSRRHCCFLCVCSSVAESFHSPNRNE